MARTFDLEAIRIWNLIFPNNIHVSDQNEFTWSIWWRLRNVSASDQTRNIYTEVTNIATEFAILQLDPTTPNSKFKLRFTMLGAPAGPQGTLDMSSGKTDFDTNWHHAAVVRSAANKFKVFLDGAVAANKPNHDPGTLRVDNVTPLIGAANGPGDTDLGLFGIGDGDGDLAFLQTYNRGLSESEIDSIRRSPGRTLNDINVFMPLWGAADPEVSYTATRNSPVGLIPETAVQSQNALTDIPGADGPPVGVPFGFKRIGHPGKGVTPAHKRVFLIN